MRNNVPNIEGVDLSAHCHNDLGMAVANSLAAIECGATQIEGTINGIGERAGNAAIEEVAVALRIRNDFYQAETGLKLDEIKRTSNLVSKLTGMAVPGNKAVVGANAFAHESGIHQDGVLKEKTTYEIISPQLIGVQSNSLVLGKHSGRHAFRDKVKDLGFELDEAKINEAFADFKDLADKKKQVTEDDLFALLTDIQTDEFVDKYEIHSIQVQYGTANIPTATISIEKPDGTMIQQAGTGSGSVEAIYNTLEAMIPGTLQLQDYRINSVGGGRDALAEVHVRVMYNGVESNGRGTAQDVLESSAIAYLNAVNRVLARESYQVNKKAHV